MKIILFVLTIVLVGFTACDKVENAYPPSPEPPGLWNELYPNGDSSDYVSNEWPTFTENLNTNRNILIEDFTGHRCSGCPAAAVEAELIAQNNYPRVVISTIHSGPSGVGSGTLQDWSVGDQYFYHDFTSDEGSQIGIYFGSIAFSGFFGNPRGLISRIPYIGEFTVGAQNWSIPANTILSANDLKVNLQAETNYYPSTRGLFLHTEIDLLDPSLDFGNLKIVAQLHQDSIVRPQQFPNSIIQDNYVHRDILIGCLDQLTFGKALDTDHLDANGKYYFNYAYRLPGDYNADNMHLVIYVRDAVTEEVYQVIKQTF